MKWIPSWLGQAYSALYSEFGTSEFSLEDAEEVLRRERKYVRVVLSRLREAGWCVREGRGRYRLLSPLECVLMMSGLSRLADRVPQKEYAPLLRKVVLELVRELGDSLMGILLFGSVARGEARMNSDVDLLVVAEGLPSSYMERARIMARVVEKTRGERIKLFSKGIHPTLQIIAYTPEEMEVFRALYFDLAVDGIILYSRRGYVEELLRKIRRTLEESKARKVVLPGGRWYWVVGKDEEISSRLLEEG